MYMCIYIKKGDQLNMPKVGDKIKIISMEGEPQYSGRTGTIEHIDDIGQLHGTWGGCAIIPGTDMFVVID